MEKSKSYGVNFIGMDDFIEKIDKINNEYGKKIDTLLSKAGDIAFSESLLGRRKQWPVTGFVYTVKDEPEKHSKKEWDQDYHKAWKDLHEKSEKVANMKFKYNILSSILDEVPEISLVAKPLLDNIKEEEKELKAILDSFHEWVMGK